MRRVTFRYAKYARVICDHHTTNFFLQTTSTEKVRASSWHSPSLTTSMDDERELFFWRLFPFPPFPPNFISFSAPSEAGNLRCKGYNSLSLHYFTQDIVSSAVYFGDFKPKHQMLWVLYQRPTVVMIQQEINLFIISPPVKTPQLWLYVFWYVAPSQMETDLLTFSYDLQLVKLMVSYEV